MKQSTPETIHTIQKGSFLEFGCISCGSQVGFSVLDLGRPNHSTATCGNCGRAYSFEDEVINRQLRKFEALCRQIHDAEEILSDTAVSVDIGPHNVKVPYKLLLTRLTSELSLNLDGQEVRITFRIEPSQDYTTN